MAAGAVDKAFDALKETINNNNRYRYHHTHIIIIGIIITVIIAVSSRCKYPVPSG